MKCHQCDRNALYAVEVEKGKEIALCLDCYIKFQNIHLQQVYALQREINYLKSHMETIAGLPGTLPRYPEPPQLIQSGGITLNNIQVSNSEIGVLNTGSIENVDATVTVLKTGGNSELAIALKSLTEEVIKSKEITNEIKDKVLELLSAISEEAVAPKEKRKGAVIKALISEITSVLSGISSLASSWDAVKTIFEKIFSS